MDFLINTNSTLPFELQTQTSGLALEGELHDKLLFIHINISVYIIITTRPGQLSAAQYEGTDWK